MANKVLGIEIGQNLTRVAEVDYKAKNPKIYNVFSFPTPPDMINDGVVAQDGMFRSLLHGKLKEKKITTNKVVFILNSVKIASREIEIPLVKDKQIKDVVAMNASDYFPVDLSEYKLVHEIIERIENGDEKKLRLSVIAIPNELILSYEGLAADCKLSIAALDYSGNATKELMIREIPGEVKAAVKIDEASATLTIIDGDTIKLQRNITNGLSEAIEEIQDSEIFGEYLSFSDAIDIARRKTCLSVRADETAPETPEKDSNGKEIDSERMRKLRSNVTYALSPLVNSIGRMIDYYQSSHSDRPVERLFLIGLGADFSGLSKLLTNELKIKVVPLQQFDGIHTTKNINLAEAKMAEYFNCVGAVLDPLSIFENDKEKFKLTSASFRKSSPKAKGTSGDEEEGDEEEQVSYGLPLVIFGLCVVASVGLVAYSIFSNLVLTSDNMTLKGQVSDLSYAQEIYDTYMSTKSDYDWTMKLDDAASNKNDELISFLDELEQKLPSEATIVSFSAAPEGISITVQQNSKDIAADVVAQFRTFDSIQVASVSTITDETDETGASVVEFTISCVYVSSADDAAENESTENAASDSADETADESTEDTTD